MAKDETAPDFDAESESGDDVEILEVVGVDDEPQTFEVEPGGGSSGGADEYLLDLDDPAGGILADPPQEGAPAEAGQDSNSDRTRLMRLRADYDNLRKRIDRERAEFELNANLGLVGRLLPILDNLDRALASSRADDGSAGLREGLVMIYKQLTDQLADEGLQPIEALGQAFDPNLHDAVATAADADAPAGTVVEQFQPGYLFRNRVLRPAMVKVSTREGNGANESSGSEEDSR